MTKWFKYIVYLFVIAWFSVVKAGSYEDFFKGIELDNARMVGQLLERGFDPNTPNKDGQVALYIALRDRSPQVVPVLMAHPGLKVDAANANGETPLMMAALRGELEWTKRLIALGAQVNREGWTPLHYAASGPEPKVVALLLDRGAVVDALSPRQSTPLMLAAQHGSAESVTLLLNRGADPRRRNDRGLSAADLARASTDREALADRLDAAAR